MESSVQTLSNLILAALAPILFSGISYLAFRLAQWAKKKEALLESQLSQGMNGEQWYLLKQIVVDAIKAAEKIVEDNSDKKAYAIGVVQAWLDHVGIHLDVTVIEALIESAVSDGLHKTNSLVTGTVSQSV